jgi:hypothetical protein
MNKNQDAKISELEAILREIYALAREVVDTYEGFDTTPAAERLRSYLESHGVEVRRTPGVRGPMWRGIQR